MSLTDDASGRLSGRLSRAQVHRVETGGRSAAINVLLTGRPSVTRDAVAAADELTTDPYFSWEHLWAAYENGSPKAAALLMPMPGRTAMYLASPVWEQSQVWVAGDLARQMCSAQDPTAIRMIQALLNPEDELPARSLLQAGFLNLAVLSYLQAPTVAAARRPPLDGRHRLVGWSDHQRPLFSRAILDSYEETLDCPALRGLRSIDDILTGHMAVGDFDPSLWFVLTKDREPIAVLLLNPVSYRNTLELVYLGVHRNWRGKGIGRWLVQFALSTAFSRGESGVVLAVDESNTPAVSLYQSLGFAASMRKLAMIFTLPVSGNPQSPSYPPLGPTAAP